MPTKQAVFIIGFLDDELENVAATTRLDKPGSIGLPGGKVEPGESLVEAALREAKEEGWDFYQCEIDNNPIHQEKIDIFDVYWFLVIRGRPIKLVDYKEKYRKIEPIVVPAEKLNTMGNENALPKAKDFLLSKNLNESILIEESPLSWSFLKKQARQLGVDNNLTKDNATMQKLEEIARRSINRLRHHFKNYDTGLISAFRALENLPPLPNEKYIRMGLVPGNPLIDKIRQYLANKDPKFSQKSPEQQENDIALEFAERKRIITLPRNRKRNQELKSKIEAAGYSYVPVRGQWSEFVGGKYIPVSEESFFVIDHNNTGRLRDDLIRWGLEYEQDAVIFKPAGLLENEIPGPGEEDLPRVRAELISTRRGSGSSEPGTVLTQFGKAIYNDPNLRRDTTEYTQAGGTLLGGVMHNFSLAESLRIFSVNTELIESLMTDLVKRRIIERWWKSGIKSGRSRPPTPEEREKIRKMIQEIDEERKHKYF
ncbi:MAG: NUDIX domain-containing protein [Candidatus Dojkabacteria bacterium]|nr:NUDIX domain-containing protein [Candidatus Dojkabacteria bacterium]